MGGVRVVGFAPAGAGANFFASWGTAFEAEGMQLEPVELPGRGRRVAERPLSDWSAVDSEALRVIMTAPQSTTVLLGHSFGALVAYRAAVALHRSDEHPIVALVVAARRPPVERTIMLPSSVDDQELLDLVERLGGLHPVLRADASFMQSLLPVLRADLDLDASGSCSDRTVLDIPIVGLAGDDDPTAGLAVMSGWSHFTHGTFRLVGMPGGHFFVRDHVATVVRQVALAVRCG